MQILLISPYFFPHIGGSQQYAYELYKNLMSKDKSVSVDVICYNTRKSEVEEKRDGFTIYRIPCWDLLDGQFAFPNYLSLIRLIRKLKKRYNYDLVNSHTRFFDNSWWAPVTAKYLGAKSILTDHASSSPVHSSVWVTFTSNLIERIMAHIMVKFYDLVTVTNKATLSLMKKYGVKDPKLVYGGVDVSFFTPLKRKNKRVIPKLGDGVVNKDSIIITFVGRMIKTKGPLLLLEAAQKLVEFNDKLLFVFAGEGEIYEKFKDSRFKNIHFIGPLNKEEIALLFASTDIMVNPTMHFEGFPNVLLEAGSSGCAVLATDNGGTKELIVDGETGLIIEPDSNDIIKKILHLIHNKNFRLKLGKQIRSKIENEFSWRDISQIYKNILYKLLKL